MIVQSIQSIKSIRKGTQQSVMDSVDSSIIHRTTKSQYKEETRQFIKNTRKKRLRVAAGARMHIEERLNEKPRLPVSHTPSMFRGQLYDFSGGSVGYLETF